MSNEVKGLNPELLALLGDTFGNDFKVTQLTDSLQGKVIIVSGGNNLGKSSQMAKMPNPIFLTVENGLNGIANVGALPVRTWNDMLKYNRKFGDKKFKALLDKGTEITLIIDGAEGLGMLCRDFICSAEKVNKIKEGNGGYGLWQEYAEEVDKFAKGFTSLGYCVVLIWHEEADKDGKTHITGDKRLTAPFMNLADIVIHLESQGVDEQGNEIPSKGYMYECPDFFGRTKFRCMDIVLEEFSAENLINAYREGIYKQAEEDGVEVVSYQEQRKQYETKKEDYAEVKAEVEALMDKIPEESDLEDEMFDALEEVFGVGFELSDITKKQLLALIEFRDRLKYDILKEE